MIQFIRTVRNLPFVEDISASVEGFDCYYGMNVSTSLLLEPIDQLDGFLVARIIQDQIDSRFYPFIAGVYESLNSSSPKEAVSRAKRVELTDVRKRELIINVMSNMGLEGDVYITYDLWENEDYWEMFRDVISNLNRYSIKERTPKSKQGMSMKDFPKQVLGKMERVVPNGLVDDWDSNEIYIPAEVAEAIWFKEKLGVSFKIGPKASESIYDDIISGYGIGIIGLTQPEYTERARLDENGNLVYAHDVKTVPYTGKRGQNRIFFSDTPVDIMFKMMDKSNPSFKRALSMAECYERLTGNNGYVNDTERVYRLVRLGRCQE